MQWFAPSRGVQNHLVREVGLRLGVLVGTEEQFDITTILTSSFDADTPVRFLFGLGYEFR